MTEYSVEQEKASKAVEARKFELLDQLTHQEGWTILVNHINTLREAAMTALLYETDPTKIIRIQEKYRAFNSVLDTIQRANSIKDGINQQIKQLIEDEELRKEFELE